jgi:signal transduction histidine kinase
MSRELTGLLVHDLKNQLGHLEAELAMLSQQHAAVASAHRHCAQLRQRLVAYLTIYGGDEPGLVAQLEDESPSAFLASLAQLASRPEGAPLQLLGEPPPPPFWYFDARLVRLALEAALHNAWRFARSQVWLSAHARDGGLSWVVEDDGAGLGAKDPSAQSSTGLGMALCAAVARAHRREALSGRVSLGARTGGGTRFELWIP